MRSHHDLAQGLGQELGIGPVLLGCLSGQKERGQDLTTGKTLHDTDLDACHGTTSTVLWNGHLVTLYHYVLTPEYPYTLGCFKGTPVAADLSNVQKNQIAAFP